MPFVVFFYIVRWSSQCVAFLLVMIDNSDRILPGGTNVGFYLAIRRINEICHILRKWVILHDVFFILPADYARDKSSPSSAK